MLSLANASSTKFFIRLFFVAIVQRGQTMSLPFVGIGALDEPNIERAVRYDSLFQTSTIP